MTARQILLQQIADLSEDDAHALLPIVERLRAKRVAPGSPQAATGASSEAPPHRRHPERFGPLVGSLRRMGDVEHPVENDEAWTCDDENLKP